jgi:hypothetical protein
MITKNMVNLIGTENILHALGSRRETPGKFRNVVLEKD